MARWSVGTHPLLVVVLVGIVVWKDLRYGSGPPPSGTAAAGIRSRRQAYDDDDSSSSNSDSGPGAAHRNRSSSSGSPNNGGGGEAGTAVRGATALEDRVSELAALVESLLAGGGGGSGGAPAAPLTQDEAAAPTKPPLPRCDELMRLPNSPFGDGGFLTNHRTKSGWVPRADGSRQFDLEEICHLKRYTSDEANICLKNKHVAMVGDSLTRYQYLSLVHFLERGQFPPRFRRPPAPNEPCPYVNETGHPSCSPFSEPNICVEFDWGSWKAYYASLGGSNDGGILNGRMECRSHRPMPSEKGEGNDNVLYVNGNSKAVLSFAMEIGWGDSPKPLQGFAFSNCSYEGTCRRTEDDYAAIANRSGVLDFDWNQPFPEAVERNGSLRGILPRADYALYNRGIWGQLSEDRARRIMPAMFDWVQGGGAGAEQEGRCFFKSTTGNYNSLRNDVARSELFKVRHHAHRAGCSYLDYAHLTERFAALDWEEHLASPRRATERASVYVDNVHFQPWVYEELNQVLLNVICNGRRI